MRSSRPTPPRRYFDESKDSDAGRRAEFCRQAASIMNNAVWFACIPIIVVAAAVALTWGWPGAMRTVSRCLAVASSIALLGIMATGWLHRPGLIAQTHRWLPHALIILDFNAIPLAIGVTSVYPRGHPLAAVARALGLLALLGIILLASFTGYLGPSNGGIDPMTFRRFQVLHYWVLPSVAIVLVIWWYRSSRPGRKTSPRDATKTAADA